MRTPLLAEEVLGASHKTSGTRSAAHLLADFTHERLRSGLAELDMSARQVDVAGLAVAAQQDVPVHQADAPCQRFNHTLGFHQILHQAFSCSLASTRCGTRHGKAS